MGPLQPLDPLQTARLPYAAALDHPNAEQLASDWLNDDGAGAGAGTGEGGRGAGTGAGAGAGTDGGGTGAGTVVGHAPEQTWTRRLPAVSSAVTAMVTGRELEDVPTSKTSDWPTVQPASIQLAVFGVQSAKIVLPGLR
jgi:hypothetical protein